MKGVALCSKAIILLPSGNLTGRTEGCPGMVV